MGTEEKIFEFVFSQKVIYNRSIMKTSTTQMERVIAAVGSVFLFVSFLASIFLDGDIDSILELIPFSYHGHPFTSILLPIVHGLCLLGGIFSIIKPKMKILASILLIESFITILTAYEQLGIFFFYAAVVLLLIHEQFSKKSIIKAQILLVFHFIAITLMFTHGWSKTFVAYFTSIFYATFFYCIFTYLKSEFCILPANVSQNNLLRVGRGNKINLSEYKLSERQINLIIDTINENLSYKDLSEKYFISISTVKKDFADIFKIFEVTNINELKILLMQFQITK